MKAAKSTGLKVIEQFIFPLEKISREVLFDCQLCGQWMLHLTGLTCPMRCPKNLRNGPCGGALSHRQD